MFGWLFGSKENEPETYVEKLNNMKFNDFRIKCISCVSMEEIASFLPENMTLTIKMQLWVSLNFNDEEVLTWHKEYRWEKNSIFDGAIAQKCILTFKGIEDVEVQEKLAKLIYDINAYGIEKHKRIECFRKEQLLAAMKERENKLRNTLL